jgi:23S rRNA (uracil1939-C5)-methyltransferase
MSSSRAKRKPVTADAIIESLNYDGRGVTHVGNNTVFVDGALPGEAVTIEYRKKRRKIYEGQVLSIQQQAPDRIQPRCPYFGVCGGCSLQHMSATAQIDAKLNVLKENLQHIGKLSPEHYLPALTDQEWGYRRKARLGLRYVPKKGGLLLGFRERRSSYVTNLDACLNLDERISSLLTPLRECIASLFVPEQIPQIEVAGGEHGLVFVIRHLQALADTDLHSLRLFSQDHDVQIFLQDGGLESIYCLAPDHPEPLSFSLPDYKLTYHFLPTDFTQVNFGINRKMVAQAMGLLELDQKDAVLELFCGLGNFTLPMALQASKVLGIEGNDGLVDRARKNAERNNITNAEFRSADLYGHPDAGLWRGFEFNKVLLDPPRSGAQEVLPLIMQQKPERIVYVSCNPATLARDSAYLVHEQGYTLYSAGVMDMFPHTSHVESIALFLRGRHGVGN